MYYLQQQTQFKKKKINLSRLKKLATIIRPDRISRQSRSSFDPPRVHKKEVEDSFLHRIRAVQMSIDSVSSIDPGFTYALALLGS